MIVMFPIGIFVLELAKNDEPIKFANFKNMLKNPIILSTLLGPLYALSGLQLPLVVANYLNIFSSALTTCALFAIGLDLSLRSFKTYAIEISLITFIKLIILPMLVFIIGSYISLDPFLLICAIIAAAVPTAKAVYILAAGYEVSKERIAAILSANTCFSVITIFVWLILLSHLYPHVFIH